MAVLTFLYLNKENLANYMVPHWLVNNNRKIVRQQHYVKIEVKLFKMYVWTYGVFHREIVPNFSAFIKQ